MAQTALNGDLVLEQNVWTLISEANCTFVMKSDYMEIIGTDGTVPDAAVSGIPYARGSGETASTDTLGRFVGAGGATSLFVIARGYSGGTVFISREAVA